MIQSEMDSCNVICPHCGYKYQAEAEDFDEQEREEECDKCDKKFIRYDEYEVTYHTRTK